MLCIRLIGAVFFLLGTLEAASGQVLKVGGAAPEFRIEQTVPAGTGSGQESTRGKPVVLEFWATWCGYCLEEIPRLNELAGRFPDVRFISVSDEDTAVVEAFLAKRPIQGTVAIDRRGEIFKAFGIETRPQTVLIDANGTLRGIIHPAQLNAAVMSDFVAGRPIAPPALRRSLRTLEDNSTEPLFAAVIRPARKRGSFNINPGYIQGEGIRLKSLLAYAHSTYETRLESTSELMETRYDFCVSLPTGMTGEAGVLRDMLDRSFRIKSHWESREVDALVLKAAHPTLREIKRLGPTVKGLAGTLERILKQCVVDETGLSGYFEIDAPSAAEEVQAFLKASGLELAPGRRTVQFLMVDALELPKFQ